MLNCRQIEQQSDLLLAGELPWQRRLAIHFHLLICRHCRRYLRQLRLLIAAIPYMHAKASDEEVSKVMACLHSTDDKTF